MPTYEAQCIRCDSQFEYFAAIADCLNVPNCELCNSPARKVILSSPQGFVKGKFEAFKSMVDGTVISTASDLAEHNKRNGVTNLNDGYSEEQILAGQVGQKPVESQKEDVAKVVAEATQAVAAGYKPTIGAEDD